jgi:putative ABC transport system permease protein
MRDIRQALRNLIRRPAFSLIAVLTLALGIGANTAVFTVSHAVLLSPLPYDRPAEVVILHERTPQFPLLSVTRYNYEDWRDRARSFTGMAAFRSAFMTVTGPGEPERVPVRYMTATLLPLLGVQVGQGRGFIEADDRPGAEPVAILSAAFAARRFPVADPTGQPLLLDGHPHTIVGILPPEFELFQPADVYLPFGPWAATLPEDRGWHPGILPIARLAEGVTIEQARLEMDEITQQLEAEYPASNTGVRAQVTRVQDHGVQPVRPALVMLTVAVLLVLLIACANVANLLLARAVDRQKEIAVRIALGASRLHIVRQFLVESVVLACIGGAAGLLVAAWTVSLFVGTATTALPRAQNIAIEWPVLLFALGLSVATGILFGVIPALQAARMPIRDALNEEGRGGAGGPRHRRMRSALVVAEIGLALVLLIGAGLLIRSFAALTQVSPGFDPANLLVVNLPLSPAHYGEPPRRAAFAGRLVHRVTALPGVQRAGLTTTLPMAGAGATLHFNRMAYPPQGPDDYVMTGFRAVTPGYLETLGVPLRRGRMISARDHAGAPRVAVINESMARQYFPDRDALGERIMIGTEPSPDFPAIEIVGIVGDVRQSFETGSGAEMFLPYVQFPTPQLTPMYLNTALVVRTAGEPLDLAGAVRAAVRELDAAQPLVNVRTMEAAMAGTVAQPRSQMTLLLVFASIAVALAAIGVYGVMAYTVSQRIPEIGIRLAVGASPSQVVWMVVWQGAQLALMGTALGMIAAALASGAIQGLLFDVRGLDPLTFVVAPLVLGAAALLASYIPARRAARISPLVAMTR